MKLDADYDAPETWGRFPLKRLARFGYGEAIAADDRDYEGDVLVYGSNGPFDRHRQANTFGPCIIIGRKGSYGKCHYSEKPVFAVDTTFILDRRHTDADIRYLFYLINSLALDALSDDTAVPGLSREKAYQSLVPMPPINAQRQIAVFLDEKTAQIDALIEKKRALLELLAEKRQAIITQAVTKGLDPTGPVRDSGIGWIGNIPSHWILRKLKFSVQRVVDCLHTTPHYDGDLVYPAIRTADIDRGLLLLEQARLVSEEVYLERIQRLKPIAGDVLYSREGERFGMAALVPEDVNLCLGQRLMMFRPEMDMDPAYLMWCLNSQSIYEQVALYAGGSTSPHVNIGDIINFFVPCPPKREQLGIGEHISACCRSVESHQTLVAKSEKMLAEYRLALITAAVTGQIEELR